MIETVDERSLILRAQAGDTRALNSLIQSWTPRVQRFASRLCPAAEVIDAVQDSLLIFATKIHKLRVTEALVSWLFQIVKRQCQKAFSFLRRDTALARSLAMPREFSHISEPERELLLGELSRIMAQLESSDRIVIIYKDIEGMSVPEIAEKLDESVAAVKSRLLRARRRLRDRVLKSALIRAYV